MNKRLSELNKLKAYTEIVDNKLTMILQSLQWDREELLQKPPMVTCCYDSNHKLPPDKLKEHEKECFLRQNGYTKDTLLLPDPLDPQANTLVKLSKQDIQNIIGNAARLDPVFKKVYRNTIDGSELPQISEIGCRGAEPMSLERLQQVYSADERRAIHDAVVSAVPSCHDLADLALLNDGDDQGTRKILSRMEILVELRNMRRRRTKYRVAAKSRNYSDVLRDVIKTQMEHYTDGKCYRDQEHANDRNNKQSQQNESGNSRQVSKDDDKYSYENCRKFVPRPIVKIEIKQEREDSTETGRDFIGERSERTYSYEDRRRDRHYRYSDRRDKCSDRHDRHSDRQERHPDRHRIDERSRERAHDRDVQRSHRHQDQSRKRHNEDFDKNYKAQESRHKRKVCDSDKEYDHEKSKKSRRHRDTHHIKQEPVSDEDINNYYREKEKRYSKRNGRDGGDCEESLQTDRGRFRESQDKRYEVRYREREHRIKQRESSISTDDWNERERRHDEGRHERPYRNANSDSYSRSGEINIEKCEPYYDNNLSDECYDPHKKIKREK